MGQCLIKVNGPTHSCFSCYVFEKKRHFDFTTYAFSEISTRSNFQVTFLSLFRWNNNFSQSLTIVLVVWYVKLISNSLTVLVNAKFHSYQATSSRSKTLLFRYEEQYILNFQYSTETPKYLAYTEKISNSNATFCLPKILENPHTSQAFFLTFGDATYHMRGHLIMLFYCATSLSNKKGVLSDDVEEYYL